MNAPPPRVLRNSSRAGGMAGRRQTSNSESFREQAAQRSTPNVQLAESGKANQEPHENRKGTREAGREKQEVGRVDIRSFLCQGDFPGTAGALTFTSIFLVPPPLPPENWPLRKKSAAATTIIISHEIGPPLCAHNSHLVGDVTV